MIGSVISLGSLFVNLAKHVYPDNTEVKSAGKALDVAKHSYNVVSTNSVHESANRAIISPMTVIDESILHAEYMNDLMQIVMLRDVVATLTHIALQGSMELGVKVENVIGSINPKRSGLLSLSGLEKLDTSITSKTKDTSAEDAENEKLKDTVGYKSDTTKDLTEYTPLAIGKVVNATLYRSNAKAIDFPLTFRQIPVPAKMGDLSRIFGATKIEEGFFARWFQLTKTQEITTPEFLTGKDVVKERFRIKNEDMSGYYKEALKRESNNRKVALRTGVMSMNSHANCFIISKDTANQLELDIGKRFDDHVSRSEIFKSIKANTIVIANEDRGIFTFYTVGTSMREEYTRKEIQVKSKKDTGGSTLTDLVNILNGR